MAETWRARLMGAAGVTKPVLIKKVLPQFANDQAFSAMFVSEARITATLSHGNIAQVFDFGQVDGEYFLAMELVDGQPLNRILKRAQKTGLPALPVPLATYIAMEMCRGLHYAHTRADDAGVSLGIVHRDISPDNVLVSYEGQVKIVDFGIAKARELRNFKTEPGVVKGKYLFFSPEQARGEEVDARTDVWACGVVLYEMLCGRLPLEGPPYVVMRKLVQGEFPQPRALREEVPPELNAIVMRALTVDAERRFQSCNEFGDALAGFLYSTAPRFSTMSLSHLVKELFRQDLSNEGREVRVPHSFLEELSLWRGEPPPPAKPWEKPLVALEPVKNTPASPKPRTEQLPASLADEDEDEAEPAEAPPEPAGTSRGLLAVLGGAAALSVAAAVVLLQPGEPPPSSAASTLQPLPRGQGPGALDPQMPASPTRMAQPVDPSPQPMRPSEEPVAKKRRSEQYPVDAFRLDAKQDLVRVSSAFGTFATASNLDPQSSYSLSANVGGSEPPLFYLLSSPSARPANDSFGELPRQPQTVSGVKSVTFFMLGQPLNGLRLNTVSVKNQLTGETRSLRVSSDTSSASMEEAFLLEGLDGSSVYELRLVPDRGGAYTRGVQGGEVRKVLCSRRTDRTTLRGVEMPRLEREQQFLLEAGKPFMLEAARALSCGFLDDDPSDNQGGVEIRITRFTTRHASAAPDTESPASGTSAPAPEEAARLLADATQLIKAKQYAEAANLLDFCIRRDPSNADCHLRRGVAYAGLGNIDEGSRSYRRFMELAPNHPQAPKVREMLNAYDAKKRAMAN
jgi:serine/threonine-protein kinase